MFKFRYPGRQSVCQHDLDNALPAAIMSNQPPKDHGPAVKENAKLASVNFTRGYALHNLYSAPAS
jgi:hypothetical protein